MKAVIYESNTGHARRYAEMIAAKSGISCIPAREAYKTLDKGSEVLYVGWVMANEVVGYKKAAKRFAVKAVCAVGLFPAAPPVNELIEKRNKLNCPLFYLRGGIDISKLHGVHALMMKLMKKGLENTDKLDDGEREMLDILNNSPDFLCHEQKTKNPVLCKKARYTGKKLFLNQSRNLLTSTYS